MIHPTVKVYEEVNTKRRHRNTSTRLYNLQRYRQTDRQTIVSFQERIILRAAVRSAKTVEMAICRKY